MPYLLSAPSLPKRLLRCPFEPITLTLTLASLISIWTNYTLLNAYSNPEAEDNSPRLITSTATATSKIVISATCTSTFTPTTTFQGVQASIEVNDGAIEEIIEKYSVQKMESLTDLVKFQVLDPLCSEWTQNLENWNNSLNWVMETKNSDYNSFQAFKDDISLQFQQESSRINETVDLLSRTALTVGQVNGQELTQNLSLSYWLIDNLFTNFTARMNEFDNLYRNVRVPAVTCPEFSLTLVNISESLDKTKTNFLAALHSIEKSHNSNVTVNAKWHTSKALERPSGESLNLLKRCRLLTLITCISYLVMVIVVGLYEMLIFSFERSIFNLHMADMLDRYSEGRESQSEIKMQQSVRSTTQELTFSLKEAMSYKIANRIYFSGGSSVLTWQRLSSACLWIWSSGKIFWILIFYTVVHFQILSSLTQSHQISATTGHQATLMNKANDPAFKIASHPSSIYLETQEACEDLEATFENIMATSAKTHLVDLVHLQIDGINSEMTVLANQFNAVSWANISSNESLTFSTSWETAGNNSLTYMLMSQLIENHVSLDVSGATQDNKSTLFKRNYKTPQGSNYRNLTWHSIIKWFLIAITSAAFIHHLLGFIILN